MLLLLLPMRRRHRQPLLLRSTAASSRTRSPTGLSWYGMITVGLIKRPVIEVQLLLALPRARARLVCVRVLLVVAVADDEGPPMIGQQAAAARTMDFGCGARTANGGGLHHLSPSEVRIRTGRASNTRARPSAASSCVALAHMFRGHTEKEKKRQVYKHGLISCPGL